MNFNKKDFPFFKHNKNTIYLDNSGTSVKPKKVIDEITSYYTLYSTNAHNTDSNIGFNLINKLENCRKKVQNFINAKESKEIIFVPSTTFGINQISYGLKNTLQENDEIVITEFEHASNFLPWYDLYKEKKIKLKFLVLKNFLIDIEKIKKIITNKTKIVSFASVSNTLGYYNDIKKIIKEIKKINKNIIVIVDAAQSIISYKIDVQDFDIDFLVFSAHKIFGPTGIGVLYGKEKYLEKLKPILLGGGVSSPFSSKDINKIEISYNPLPYCLEGGTPNMAGIFGLCASIDYINEIGGIDKIREYVYSLQSYAIKKMKEILKEKVIFYNDSFPSSILLFNIKNVFSQDVASFLGNEKKIIVRSGEHCTKMFKTLINTDTTIRISFSIYNNKKEIDTLINILRDEQYFLGNLV